MSDFEEVVRKKAFKIAADKIAESAGNKILERFNSIEDNVAETFTSFFRYLSDYIGKDGFSRKPRVKEFEDVSWKSLSRKYVKGKKRFRKKHRLPVTDGSMFYSKSTQLVSDLKNGAVQPSTARYLFGVSVSLDGGNSWFSKGSKERSESRTSTYFNRRLKTGLAKGLKQGEPVSVRFRASGDSPSMSSIRFLLGETFGRGSHVWDVFFDETGNEEQRPLLMPSIRMFMRLNRKKVLK